MGKGSGKEKKKGKGGKKMRLHETGARARSSKKAPVVATPGEEATMAVKKVVRPAGKREIMPWESLVRKNMRPGATHLHQAYASARSQYLKASPQRQREIHAESLGISIEELDERLEMQTADRARRQAEEEKARLERRGW